MGKIGGSTEFAYTESECKEVGGVFNPVTCVCRFPSEMKRLQANIYRLLYFERPERKDPELLTIVIRKDKAGLFDYGTIEKIQREGCWRGTALCENRPCGRDNSGLNKI